VPDVELLTLELGVGLLRLVDSSRGGKLMDEISTLRRTIIEELGFVVPKILVRDAVELDPREYRIRLRDVPIAQGPAYHDALLSFDAGAAERVLEGIAARHPVTGVDAHWIEPSRAEEARGAGLKVLEPQQVIAAHLYDVVLSHAAELLTRSQLHGLLNQCRELNGKLVDETVPALISVPRLHQVLRALLAEQVPIRDLRAILEALSFTGPQSSLDRQIEACRTALSRSICRRFRNQRFELRAWVLGQDSEQFLLDCIDRDGELRLTPADQARLLTELSRTFGNDSHAPHTAVLLTAAPLRAPLGRLAARGALHLNTVSRNELTRDTQLVIVGSLEFPAAPGSAPQGLSHKLTAEAFHE
jgi:flagellar biosynthesis protein FlhA